MKRSELLRLLPAAGTLKISRSKKVQTYAISCRIFLPCKATAVAAENTISNIADTQTVQEFLNYSTPSFG